MVRESETSTAQAVVKAIDLLEALASDQSAATIPHLAKVLKLNRKKVVQLLDTMENKRLIERDELGTYHLGLHSFSMAQNILKNANLIRIVHPVMESLARKHEETVCFTVLDNDEVFFLDVVDSFQQIKAPEVVGRRFPFFTNAAGKVIKSLSSLELFKRLPGRRKKNMLQHPDPELLQRELDEIRKKGIAIDVGGFGDDVCTVAVAIRDYAGKVVGALTMLVPSIRLVQERLETEIIPSMLEGAELLSGQFGYTRSYA